MGENSAISKELLDKYEPMRCNLSSSSKLQKYRAIFKKECIKNCLIVMPFNKILIIFYIFGALYGVGDRVSRVIVYQKKIQETTIYPGKLMKTIPYRES